MIQSHGVWMPQLGTHGDAVFVDHTELSEMLLKMRQESVRKLLLERRAAPESYILS